ncbi:MAG: hypothetical protein LBP22_06050 [Deltaproteobacteria bacterium]|jgi:hypothetical protein|nr:hypothetical protein [Deltaproteobacteria bacterium]
MDQIASPEHIGLFYWRLTCRLPFEQSQELMGRLLAGRPLWNPSIRTVEESPEPARLNSVLTLDLTAARSEALTPEDIDFISQTLKHVTGRQKSLIPKLDMAWLPEPPENNLEKMSQIGPWFISSQPPEAAGEVSGRLLNLPRGIYLSHWAKVRANLALTALTDYLTPPPGAPDTRQDRILILEEGPPLLTAAALGASTGLVTLSASEKETITQAEETALFMGESERLEIIPSPLTALAKDKSSLWAAEFGLIAATVSAYALGKVLKYLLNFLSDLNGRLIATGLAAGTQTALVLKNALKAGFFLHSSATGDGQSLVNLSRRPPSDTPVWDWTPGAWLMELTEDEKSILEEAEAAEKAKALTDQPAAEVF